MRGFGPIEQRPGEIQIQQRAGGKASGGTQRLRIGFGAEAGQSSNGQRDAFGIQEQQRRAVPEQGALQVAGSQRHGSPRCLAVRRIALCRFRDRLFPMQARSAQDPEVRNIGVSIEAMPPPPLPRRQVRALELDGDALRLTPPARQNRQRIGALPRLRDARLETDFGLRQTRAQPARYQQLARAMLCRLRLRLRLAAYGPRQMREVVRAHRPRMQHDRRTATRTGEDAGVRKAAYLLRRLQADGDAPRAVTGGEQVLRREPIHTRQFSVSLSVSCLF